MDYKVLLPVTTNPELVEQKLKDIPDLTKLIMVNNFDNPHVYQVSLKAKDAGAEVYYFPQNLGLASSWNLGKRRMMEDDCDFVIILSVSAVFDKSMNHFIDYIVDKEAKEPKGRYICSGRATMHCFAHTRMAVEMGGYFDENFWPIYFEDTDYGYRSSLNGLKDYVDICGLDDVVHSMAYGIAMREPRLFAVYEPHAGRIGHYYANKWGGVHRSETFTHPFNNLSVGVNEWTLVPGVPSVPGPHNPI